MRTLSLLLLSITKIITTEVFEVKGLEGNADVDNGKFDYSKSATDTDFEKGKEYEYVAVGLGKKGRFQDLDLTGKLALIQRGEIPFAEKIANALHHGAVGALVSQ